MSWNGYQFIKAGADVSIKIRVLIKHPAKNRKVVAGVGQMTGKVAEWVEACIGGPAALSYFDYSGPFTETVLLRNLAIRAGKKIEWDVPNMKALNAPDATEFIRKPYRSVWEL